MDILQTITQAYNNLNTVASRPEPLSCLDQFLSSTVRSASQKVYTNVANVSYYRTPLDTTEGRSQGYSRNWGDASSQVQIDVMKTILQESNHLPNEDRAILLGMARIESGFNPDAAATSSSAAGVFQLIKNTGKAYGLNDTNRFETLPNVQAGIRLYTDNLRIMDKKFPELVGNDRAAMIYALHHDGPSLRYGGKEIAEEKLLPYLERFRNLASSGEVSR